MLERELPLSLRFFFFISRFSTANRKLTEEQRNVEIMWGLQRWIKSQQSAIVCRHIFLIDENLRVIFFSRDHDIETAYHQN